MIDFRVISRPVILVAVAFVIAGCGSGSAQSDASRRCPTGSDNRQAPVVCIDDTGATLSVRPDPVVIHDVREDDRVTPVQIKWYTRSAHGKLELEIAPGCVAQHHCNGGQCWSRSIPGTKDPKLCKYDIWVNRGQPDEKHLDPTIVITGCCA